MKVIYSIAIFIFSFIFLAQFIPVASYALAATPPVTQPTGGATTSNCNAPASGTNVAVNYSCLPQVKAGSATISVVLNIVFTVIGAISVLIIVLAGFKFITSSGRPEEVAKAKNTIIYAAVGLIVCIFAVTIVSFVAGYI